MALKMSTKGTFRVGNNLFAFVIVRVTMFLYNSTRGGCILDNFNEKKNPIQYYSNGTFSDEKPEMDVKKDDLDSTITDKVDETLAETTCQDESSEKSDMNPDNEKKADDESSTKDDPSQKEEPANTFNYSGVMPQTKKKKKLPTWLKALIIIFAIILGLGLLTTGCDSIFSSGGNQVVTDFGYDYIGTLAITDTIDESSSGYYDHQYVLNAIDTMMADDENKGLILYVNTPGGSVYASDELYLKIKEYKETTGRPVYSSMQSQATSGGYYISAPCDKIIANRNCWTGSLGVTMGTFVDVSELLDNLGVKTTTITAGSNKAMGSNTDPMTAEQKAIFQSLVDEAYEQFVGIVAEGRNMKVEDVKKLADGRIYTAKQALGNGLIDQIGTYEEAIADMQKTYELGNIAVEYFQPETTTDLSSLLGILSEENSSAVTDATAIETLLELNGTFKLSYLSNVSQ